MAVEYYEDFAVGDTHTFGTFSVNADEIKTFASRWDPQPFHVDEEAAEASPYDGLIASGWHTVLLAMRTIVEGFGGRLRSRGSRGVDALRWVQPLRPGDTCSVRGEVLEKNPTKGEPGRGDLRYEVVVENQDGDVVMRMESLFMVERCDEDEPNVD
jgi:acyl dehydratase